MVEIANGVHVRRTSHWAVKNAPNNLWGTPHVGLIRYFHSGPQNEEKSTETIFGCGEGPSTNLNKLGQKLRVAEISRFWQGGNLTGPGGVTNHALYRSIYEANIAIFLQENHLQEPLGAFYVKTIWFSTEKWSGHLKFWSASVGSGRMAPPESTTFCMLLEGWNYNFF